MWSLPLPTRRLFTGRRSCYKSTDGNYRKCPLSSLLFSGSAVGKVGKYILIICTFWLLGGCAPPNCALNINVPPLEFSFTADETWRSDTAVFWWGVEWAALFSVYNVACTDVTANAEHLIIGRFYRSTRHKSPTPLKNWKNSHLCGLWRKTSKYQNNNQDYLFIVSVFDRINHV